MTLDALVWLVAGVGLSLLLLMVYAAFERRRLRRRLRRAPRLDREPVTTPPQPVKAAMALAPHAVPTVSLAAAEPGPEPPTVVEPAGPSDSDAESKIPLVLDTAPSVAALPGTPGGDAPSAADDVAEGEIEPAAEPAPERVESKAQSVEEIFAQAFANDRFVKPAPDQSGDGGGSKD